MAFNFNNAYEAYKSIDWANLWARALGYEQAKTPAAASTGTSDTETEDETEQTEQTEDEESGPKSDASKDLSTDDTAMDVHTQVLDVSHTSVLARPHPTHPRYSHESIWRELREMDEYPTAEDSAGLAEMEPHPPKPKEVPTPEPVVEKVIHVPAAGEIRTVSPKKVEPELPIPSPRIIDPHERAKRVRKRPWYKRMMKRSKKGQVVKKGKEKEKGGLAKLFSKRQKKPSTPGKKAKTAPVGGKKGSKTKSPPWWKIRIKKESPKPDKKKKQKPPAKESGDRNKKKPKENVKVAPKKSSAPKTPSIQSAPPHHKNKKKSKGKKSNCHQQ